MNRNDMTMPVRSTLTAAGPVLAHVADILAAGWTKTDIAREFGLVRFHLAPDWVTVTNAALVADLHNAVTRHGHRPGTHRDPIDGLLDEIADIVAARDAPWRQAALCRGALDEMFADTPPALCDFCPVHDECAEASQAASDGWWAGVNVAVDVPAAAVA